MKKLSLLFILLLSVSTYAKDKHQGPGPFWYSISEKILTGAHQLISSDDDMPKATKVKPKAKPIKMPLKCQPKQEKKIMPKPVFDNSNDQTNDND
jgi:hypothetical protein